jgi:hypothetical protein
MDFIVTKFEDGRAEYKKRHSYGPALAGWLGEDEEVLQSH